MPLRHRAKCFFAKHPWAGLSDVVQRVDVGEEKPMLAIDDLAGLMSFVQAGVAEIHPWGRQTDHLEQPDRLIFDLDPGEDVPWGAVLEAARDLRDRLESRSLKSFVKTSGSKGLHVVVPVVPLAGWDDAKSFTASIAQAMAKDRPDRYVATVAKRAPAGSHFRRLPPQRSRCDSGGRLLGARLAASIRLDAPRLGRTLRKLALRPLYHRQPSAPPRIFEAGSLARFLQDAPADSG